MQYSLEGRLSRLEVNDEPGFYSCLSRSGVDLQAFENNFPYILQAARNNPHKYEKGGSVVYLGTKTGEGPDAAPHQPIVIPNAIGREHEGLVEEIARAAGRQGISTILKNVDRQKVDRWASRGFRETSVPWSRYSFRDDNSYPQYILDVHSFILLKPDPRARQTYRSIRKIKREMPISIEPYSKRFVDDALRLLDEYASFSQEKGKDFAFEIDQAHRFMFEEEVESKIRLVHLLDGSLVGMTYFSRSDDTIYWNGCLNKNISNIMRLLLWQGASHVIEHHGSRARWLALQGSESKGQDRWKRSFGPARKIEKTHMIFSR